MSRNVVRFVISASDGRRSSEWRVWTGREGGKPTDDVYLAPMDKIADLKISLHRDGWGQVGLSQAVRDSAWIGDRHALSRWELATSDLIDGWRPAFRLNFLNCELTPGVAADDSCIRITAPPDGAALAVLLMIGNPGARLPDWLRPFVIAMLDRRNGGQVAIVGIEVPFDINVLSFSPSRLSWTMPGAQAPPSPYGWAQSTLNDGTLVWTEFSRPIDPRNSIALPGFEGEILTWEDALPGLDNNHGLCAVLTCYPHRPPQLCVDTRSRCDHHGHLAYDVKVLVDAYQSGALDRGWNLQPDGTAYTGLLPRRRAEAADLDPTDWAPSPKPRLS